MYPTLAVYPQLVGMEKSQSISPSAELALLFLIVTQPYKTLVNKVPYLYRIKLDYVLCIMW